MLVPNSIKFLCVGSGIGAGCGIWQIPGLRDGDELIALDEETETAKLLATQLTPIVKGKPVAKDFGFHGNTHDTKFEKTYGCFSNFFGKSPFSNGTIVVNTETTENVTEVLPSDASNKGKSGPVGCALMQFSYNLKGPQWGFKSEVTLKNERTGMAMWVIGGSRKYMIGRTGRTLYVQNLHYRVAFLENENPEEGKEANWVVKGGYQWNDESVSGNSFAIHVKDPSGKELLGQVDLDFDIKSHHKRTGTPTLREYSGVWSIAPQQTDEDAKHPLEGGIQVYARHPLSTELLGRKNSFIQEYDPGNPMEKEGYRFTKIKYDTSKNEWVHVKDKHKWLDIGKALDAWYEPFRTVKGKWSDVESYCRENTTKCVSASDADAQRQLIQTTLGK